MRIGEDRSTICAEHVRGGARTDPVHSTAAPADDLIKLDAVSLSVLCLAREGLPRIRASFEQLREVADEIIVGVDSHADPAQLGELAAVADRLLRYEFTGLEKAIAWLHERCAGDWVLTLADDEVASTALLEELPELTASGDVLQYWLPTRWAFRDAGHWLDELPWYPDFHNRLVRNDGTLRFSGRKHTDAVPAFPARYVDAPLYHLDLVLQDMPARERKVKSYERAAPGLKAPGGTPLNAHYYLPELWAERPPQPVPSEDRAAIAAVLGASPSGGPAPPPAPVASAIEVEHLWAGRELPSDAYRATITAFEHPIRMGPGEGRPIHMRMANDGSAEWPWGLDQEPLIRPTYRLLDSRGRLLVDEGLRSPFTASVAPGTSCIVPLHVLAPDVPGTYQLEVDLVHEHVRWFGCAQRFELMVATPREPCADEASAPR